MSVEPDLRGFLNSWPYDPDHNVRVTLGADGREIILVRQPMGLETYEADGRPDGLQPHGMESDLELHLVRFAAALRTGSEALFRLAAADCAELFHEAALYRSRCAHFFHARDWVRMQRDTLRNLRLMDFVKQYAEHDEDRVILEQWRPATIRIEAASRAMILLQNEQNQEALNIARNMVGTVNGMVDHPRNLAGALLEYIRESLANCPIVHPHAVSEFIRKGDYWAIRYHGQAANLKATRGLDCLCYLLRHPRREIHVSELLATLSEVPGPRLPGDLARTTGLHDAGPILDTQSKAEYRRRIEELREDVEEAERFNDSDRASNAASEIDAIAHQLAGAMGLGGRDRRASSGADRARSAVTKRIKEAIQRFAETIPLLGHHLSARIKTGYFCSYNPHPDRPVAWKF